MIIGQLFNTMTLKEYFFYIDNRKKYKDFNTLGLYRSILENPKLDLLQKLEIRDYANRFFQKTFDFFQIKEPQTYLDLKTLGIELTQGDINQIWSEIKQNQQKILASKKIKHRNFGIYSKQDTFNGDLARQQRIMLRQKNTIDSVRTPYCTAPMQFKSDKNKLTVRFMSEKIRKKRKTQKKDIKKILDYI